nr:protein unc-80 homolog [Meriones unguiculatus]
MTVLSSHFTGKTKTVECGSTEPNKNVIKIFPSRKIRIGGSRLLQIKGTRSFQVKKGGSLSSIRRVGSLKSSKLSRQDSESEAEELQLSQSRDTVTDLEGSPWSASEPSIEPEGMSNAGTEENYHRNMSWLHVMILLCNQQSFICTHVDYCHPHCYLHHSRSCARLVRAIKLLYGDSVDSLRESSNVSNVALRGKKQKEVREQSPGNTPWGRRKDTFIVIVPRNKMSSKSSCIRQTTDLCGSKERRKICARQTDAWSVLVGIHGTFPQALFYRYKFRGIVVVMRIAALWDL